MRECVYVIFSHSDVTRQKDEQIKAVRDLHVQVTTYVYEEEPDVNDVKRTWFQWQWICQDIELLESKVGGDWTTVAFEKMSALW